MHEKNPNFQSQFELILSQGFINSKKTLCLFAHFDKDGVIDDYVEIYRKHLYENLSCTITFTSTNLDKRNKANYEKIKPYVSKIITRDNCHYDFGSHYAGYLVLKNEGGSLEEFEQILLPNDSVYGPLFDLRDVINKMNASDCDIWGLTDSYESGYHLQSYFYGFKKSAISFLEKFWADCTFPSEVMDVVSQIEIRLSQQALKQGLKLDAYCRCQKPWFRAPVNPSIKKWQQLIAKQWCPMVKVKLFQTHRKNKVLAYLRKKHQNYPVSVIENHLNRTVH